MPTFRQPLATATSVVQVAEQPAILVAAIPEVANAKLHLKYQVQVLVPDTFLKRIALVQHSLFDSVLISKSIKNLYEVVSLL